MRSEHVTRPVGRGRKRHTSSSSLAGLLHSLPIFYFPVLRYSLTATLTFYPDLIGTFPDLDIGYINLGKQIILHPLISCSPLPSSLAIAELLRPIFLASMQVLEWPTPEFSVGGKSDTVFWAPTASREGRA